MNWRIQGLEGDLEVEHAEGETGEPDKKLVAKLRRSAKSIAADLGGDVQVEIYGHETTKGRGFKPGHVSLTVSRIDPRAADDVG